MTSNEGYIQLNNHSPKTYVQPPQALYSAQNGQLDFERLQKMKELDNRFDSGCFVCFKIILYLSLISGIYEIISVLVNHSWADIATGGISIYASYLTLQAMKHKETKNARIALILVLVQVPFLVISSANHCADLQARIMDDELSKIVTSLMPFMIIGGLVFHFAVTVFGIYKVRGVLKERDELEVQGKFAVIQSFVA